MTSIKTQLVEHCRICGGAGSERYSGLRDHVFGAPGTWSVSSCESCGLLWLNPRPAPEDIELVYASYYTHGETERGGEVFSRYFSGPLASVRAAVLRQWHDARSTIVRRELGYQTAGDGRESPLGRVLAKVPVLRDSATLHFAELGAISGGRLLDVGCGNGEFLLRMRDLGWDVTGVEPDAAAASHARGEHGLAVRDGYLENAHFPDARFEAVVLSHVVEHVHDPVALLRECRRVLVPGGTVMVITPNVRSLGHRILGRDWRGLEPPRHLHVFDPESLAACARMAGLQVTHIRTSARLMGRIWYASRSIRRADRTGVPTNTRRDYIESYVMAGVEDLWRIVRPHVGEEVVMAATTVGFEEAR